MFVCGIGRAENSQLHQQRETLIHDHELVCRENERLLKKMSVSAAGQKTDNTGKPSFDVQSSVSNGLSVDRNACKDLKGSRRQLFDNEVQTKQTHNGSIGMSYIEIILYFNNA